MNNDGFVYTRALRIRRQNFFRLFDFLTASVCVVPSRVPFGFLSGFQKISGSPGLSGGTFLGFFCNGDLPMTFARPRFARRSLGGASLRSVRSLASTGRFGPAVREPRFASLGRRPLKTVPPRANPPGVCTRLRGNGTKPSTYVHSALHMATLSAVRL